MFDEIYSIAAWKMGNTTSIAQTTADSLTKPLYGDLHHKPSKTQVLQEKIHWNTNKT